MMKKPLHLLALASPLVVTTTTTAFVSQPHTQQSLPWRKTKAADAFSVSSRRNGSSSSSSSSTSICGASSSNNNNHDDASLMYTFQNGNSLSNSASATSTTSTTSTSLGASSVGDYSDLDFTFVGRTERLWSSLQPKPQPEFTEDSFVGPLDEYQPEDAMTFDLSQDFTTSKPSSSGLSLQNPSLNFARFLILAASAVYGTNFAIVKLLDEQIPFAVSAALRFSLAAVVVTGLVLQGEAKTSVTVSKEQVEERWPATLAGMEIGGWYCLGYLLQAMGLQTADASKSAFFNALAVIVVPLLDQFFRGKKMGFQGISSVLLAILGVGLLQLGPTLATGAAMTVTQGDWFCLGQALLFGIGYWRLEHISSQYSTQAGRITVGQLAGVAVGSTIFCGVTAGIPSWQQLTTWLSSGFTVGALVWTALVSTALALYLETVALKAVSAAELTVLMTSVSLFGSAFAYFTMGEVMSPIGMVGGLMILAGCVVSSLKGETDMDEAPAAALELTNTKTLLVEEASMEAIMPVSTADLGLDMSQVESENDVLVVDDAVGSGAGAFKSNSTDTNGWENVAEVFQ